MIEKFDREELMDMVNRGYVSMKKHDTEALWILNYTKSCQFDRVWNEITLSCRGAIVDADLNFVARPFRKFFNYEELSAGEIPSLPYTVSDKMDGSLGIMYWIGNTPYIATRGSFNSEQAVHATKVLHSEYPIFCKFAPHDITYLFEIVYPENRIVLDYGACDDIFIIGIIDTKKGWEYELPNTDNTVLTGLPPVTKSFTDVTDFTKLRDIARDNAEGFVIRFSNGFRMKMKYEEYVRLHRVITNVSSYSIYDILSEGKSVQDLLTEVPDEFYNFVRRITAELSEEFCKIEWYCRNFIDNVNERGITERKDVAFAFSKSKYKGILFLMYDGKDYTKAIWKLIKPDYEVPFSSKDDTSA